jgi:hypothetical protein
MRQFWRFSLVGVAAFAVNGGLVELLVHFLGPVRAQLIAFPARRNSRLVAEPALYVWGQRLGAAP